MSAAHALSSIAICGVLAVFVMSDASSKQAAPRLFEMALRMPHADARAAAGPVSDPAQPAAEALMRVLLRYDAKAAPKPAATTTDALRPDQKRLIERSVATVEPGNRKLAYEQMAKAIRPMSEAQIAMMMQKLDEQEKGAKPSAKPVAAQPAPTKQATPADLAFNKAQYEPAIRKAWDAQKRYDDFINAKLAAYCPGRDAAARFGSGWRYDLGQFREPSATASWNPNIDVEVLGSTYAPQDGRYTFDFSKVRYVFDEKAVDVAVKDACTAYAAAGKAFLARLDPLIAKQDWNGAFKLERTAQAGVSPIRDKLDKALAPLSPNDGYPLLAALQNPRRATS